MGRSATPSKQKRPLENKVIRLGTERAPSKAPAWLEVSLDRFNHLLTLPPNWDSYGAGCIDPYRIFQALRLLAEVMEDQTPLPQIVPTHEGGVQLEWHEHGIDLEVEVTVNARVLVSFEDALTDTEWEKSLGRDMDPLIEALEILAAREASS